MPDQTERRNDTNNTYRETRIEERRTGTGTLAFVVGGLVVAVVVIFWLFSGAEQDVMAPTGDGLEGAGGGDVNITVPDEGDGTVPPEPAAPPVDEPPVEEPLAPVPEPAPEPAPAPAPAE